MRTRYPVFTRLFHLLASSVLVWAAGCTAGATSPSSGFTLTCPAGLNADSSDANPVAVTYAPPTQSGGFPSVTITCSSPSGALFPVGTTTVTCQAVDSVQRSATCAFPIAVKGPNRIAFTRYLAFGDSITEGVGSEPIPGFRFMAAEPYPLGLQVRLAIGFPQQTFTVINSGVAGEYAHQGGVSRFRSVLMANNPEVVLLMEGTNDLLFASGPDAAIAALDTMILEAKARNVRVMLATIPPQRPDGERNRAPIAARVAPFNDQVRALAAARGVILVDVYNAMINDLNVLIGVDDLHPTDRGFAVIADTFAHAINERFNLTYGPVASTAPGWP
jgi:lysophospholipase L1-like esterase